MTKRSLVLALALALLAWLSSPAQAASILYGTLGAAVPSSMLVQINPTTGAITTIGPVGYSVNGLAWDSLTGTLYGSARSDVGLLVIDTATGTGSLVGSGFNSPASGCNAQNVLLASSSAGALHG